MPAMRETSVPPLCCEDLLRKGMATYSSILSWRIPWIVEPGKLPSLGPQRFDYNSALFTFKDCICYIYYVVFYLVYVANLI